MRRALLSAVCLLAFSATVPAFASVVTTLPSGTVYNIPNDPHFDNGPHTVAPGITWSSTDTEAVFGYSDGWGLGSNGNWTGDPMVGNNSSSDSMTFTFSTPVSSVGAFMNYYPDLGGSITISAFDSLSNLIESYTTTFSTSNDNDGRFLGFSEQSANIASFQISGPVIAARGLTANGVFGGNVAATPEPGSFMLLGTGLVGVAGSMRRRFRRS